MRRFARRVMVWHWWARWCRAAGVLAAGVAYIAATIGVMPSPASVGKVSQRLTGERYPCENGSCGCHSARECWTTCGCQSMEAKLAWAKREGVPVPAYVHVDRDRLASGSASGGGSCPLCHHEDGDALASDDDHGNGWPTIRTAGCGVLKLLIAVPTVPSRAPVVDAVEDVARRSPVRRWPRLEWDGRLAAEVPTPPPRLAWA